MCYCVWRKIFCFPCVACRKGRGKCLWQRVLKYILIYNYILYVILFSIWELSISTLFSIIFCICICIQLQYHLFYHPFGFATILSNVFDNPLLMTTAPKPVSIQLCNLNNVNEHLIFQLIIQLFKNIGSKITLHWIWNYVLSVKINRKSYNYKCWTCYRFFWAHVIIKSRRRLSMKLTLNPS